MRIFNNYKKVYIAEFSFDDLLNLNSEMLNCVFAMQHIDHPRKYLEFNYYTSCELWFYKEKLVKAFDHDEEGRLSVAIPKNHEITLPQNEMIQEVEYLSATNDGNWKLFGEVPDTLKLPTYNEAFSILYLGSIDKDLISDLPFEEIHLFIPEFCFGPVFYDYTDALAPRIINEEVVEKVNFPDKKSPFAIKTFEQLRVQRSKSYGSKGNHVGNMGLPAWVQHPEIPISPYSNKPMEFFLQIDFGDCVVETDLDYEPAVYFFIDRENYVIASLVQST